MRGPGPAWHINIKSYSALHTSSMVSMLYSHFTIGAFCDRKHWGSSSIYHLNYSKHRNLHCTLNFDPILDEIFREWSVITAVYYVITAIPKLRKIWSFRALAAFWVSLWSTSVCQAVAAVHSVVRRLHRGLTQRHSHNNIKHHSISSNIQFRLSTKASLTIFGS